jgi:hypothetical protein
VIVYFCFDLQEVDIENDLEYLYKNQEEEEEEDEASDNQDDSNSNQIPKTKRIKKQMIPKIKKNKIQINYDDEEEEPEKEDILKETQMS